MLRKIFVRSSPVAIGLAMLGSLACTPVGETPSAFIEDADAGAGPSSSEDATKDGGGSLSPTNAAGESGADVTPRGGNSAGGSSGSREGSAGGTAGSGEDPGTGSTAGSGGDPGTGIGTGTMSDTCISSAETCDGKDNDCDGKLDEGVQKRCWVDSDGDGYAASAAMVIEGCDECGARLTELEPAKGEAVDCDDASATQSPGATDICGDNLDNDCDGMPDNNSDNACGGPCTTQLPGKPGAKCSNQLKGACARTGVYECVADHTMRCTAEQVKGVPEVCGDASDNDCDGEVDNGCVKNACGGWNELPNPRGSSCSIGEGSCRSNGTYQCKGTDATECNAMAKEKNACGGCDRLSPARGASCTADCGGTGEYVCDGMDATQCNAVANPRNRCGGCERLSPSYGSSCSAECAGSGSYVCNGENATRCSVTAKQPNPCGGCEPLPNYGQSCNGECDAEGTYQCEGREATVCVVTFPITRNECGGCKPIPAGQSARTPDFCSNGEGSCIMIAAYECSGIGDARTTHCPAVALPPQNFCGSCTGEVAGGLGEPCDLGGGVMGTWTCDGEYPICE